MGWLQVTAYINEHEVCVHDMIAKPDDESPITYVRGTASQPTHPLSTVRARGRRHGHPFAQA